MVEVVNLAPGLSVSECTSRPTAITAGAHPALGTVLAKRSALFRALLRVFLAFAGGNDDWRVLCVEAGVVRIPGLPALVALLP